MGDIDDKSKGSRNDERAKCHFNSHFVETN